MFIAIMAMRTFPLSLHCSQQASSSACHHYVRDWCWIYREGKSLTKNTIKKRRLLHHALKSSSIVLKPEENEDKEEKLCKNSSMVQMEDTVGVIVGCSRGAANEFVKKIDEWSKSKDVRGLRVSVCDVPRVSCHLKEQKEVVEVLRKRKRNLEEGGVCCIVMPCEASHVWYQELYRDSNVIFLNMVDCVADQLQQMNLRPVEAGATSLKIGLVGSHSPLYLNSLVSRGFEVVLPDQATMDHIIVPAIEALQRNDLEGARILFRIAIHILLIKGVNMVVVTSHDMYSLLEPNDPLLQKCLNPLDALAKSTVETVCKIPHKE